jgi:hypothetical protein
MTQELDFDSDFPALYGDRISIPANTVLWRGYDTQYPAVSNRPTYYSSRTIAQDYAKISGRTIGAFSTKRPIRVVDVRFLKVLLEKVFQEFDPVKPPIFSDEQSILFTTISFGLCSLQHQIKLLQHVFNKPPPSIRKGIDALESVLTPKAIIEKKGYRVAETTIDGYTMAFCKELLQYYVDGFISPRLDTPFHIEKGGSMSPELILFNPEECITKMRSFPVGLPSITIHSIIINTHPVLSLQYNDFITTVYKGGSSKKVVKHPLDSFEDLLNQKNKKALLLYETALQSGRDWRIVSPHITLFEPPVPTVPIALFNQSIFKNDGTRKPLEIPELHDYCMCCNKNK